MHIYRSFPHHTLHLGIRMHHCHIFPMCVCLEDRLHSHFSGDLARETQWGDLRGLHRSLQRAHHYLFIFSCTHLLLPAGYLKHAFSSSHSWTLTLSLILHWSEWFPVAAWQTLDISISLYHSAVPPCVLNLSNLITCDYMWLFCYGQNILEPPVILSAT